MIYHIGGRQTILFVNRQYRRYRRLINALIVQYNIKENTYGELQKEIEITIV